MNDIQPWNFTCKTCGGHTLTVFHVWTTLAGPETESWQEWGPLEPDHSWNFEFKEKINNEINEAEDSRRLDIFEYEKDDSMTRAEEYEIYEPQNNPGNDKFYVNCSSCDREIEFGWSKPNRGGRIFPVECSDFNPDETWPEPKYLDSWHEKGWLRKGDNQP